MFHDFIVNHYGELSYTILYWAFRLYPLWLPIILGLLFWEVWLRYIRYLFFYSTKTILLEIRLPKEILKSPAAMELVLNSLYQTSSESTLIARYWEGKTRPWFSLEIVSEAGDVKFLVWTRENLRNLLETQIYSQFPDVEIFQVDDYTKKMDFEPGKNDMWACRYELAQADPLPIMSYIDYGLGIDKNPKEEFKIDPITTVLEYFSSIKPGENIWLQIVVRAHKNEKRQGFFSKATDWQSDVAKIRKQIYEGLTIESRGRLSNSESKILDAVERSFQKFPFDVGMRCVYIADKNVFNQGSIGGLRGLMRPFGFNSLSPKFNVNIDKEDPTKNKTTHFGGFNSFKSADSTDTDYPWQDFMNIRMNRAKRDMLEAYKMRMFFYLPYPEKTFVMTTEGLATIFHFPGSTAAAPGLKRIESKRGQAPTNLPV